MFAKNVGSIAVFITMLSYSTISCAENERIKIRSLFDINDAFCAIKTNEVLGMDNRDWVVDGDGYGAASTNAMLMLENGENEITLKIGAMGWFSKKKLSLQQTKSFSKESSCKIDLVLFKGKQQSTLASLDVKIGEDGMPTSFDSHGNPDGIKFTKINAKQGIKGHVPDDYFVENYYPRGMELYQFTRKVNVTGLPKWKWVDATPFIGSPEQIIALRQAYADLWKMLATKNHSQLKEYLAISTRAWVDTTGESAEDIYKDNNFTELLKNKSFKMIPIDWQDYEIEVMNKNRLVKFINKSIPVASPISYNVNDEDGDKLLGFFSPIFSIVDGKIVPVI